MQNKRFKRKMKEMIDRDRLKEMIMNEEEQDALKKHLKTHNDSDNVKLYMDLVRECRIDTLFEELNINVEELNEFRKKIVKLKPNSKEYKLKSPLFKNHNGLYQVETLLNQYHDSIFKEGYAIGYGYGSKFLTEDIQNGRFTKEYLKNMTKEEIIEYCDEVRDEI